MRSTQLLLGLLVVPSLACGPDESAQRAVLDRFLAADSAAHVQGDAKGLASLTADSVVSVDRGAVTTVSRAQIEQGFADYFAEVRIMTWRDLSPPVVRLTPQGRVAWVSRAVEMTRSRSAPGGAAAVDTVALAWTANLEMMDGEWRIVGVTTTSREP
jgi:ketosteroid isomerase-like protein